MSALKRVHHRPLLAGCVVRRDACDESVEKKSFQAMTALRRETKVVLPANSGHSSLAPLAGISLEQNAR